MKAEKKKYTVKIFGESYHLLSDDREELVAHSAELVDELMTDIAKRSGISEPRKLAVLAALQIASKVVSLESDVKEDLQRVKQLEQLLDDGLDSALS